MDIVFIKELCIETVIGIYDWERKIKQIICVDLELGTDISTASSSDNIDNTSAGNSDNIDNTASTLFHFLPLQLWSRRPGSWPSLILQQQQQ